MSKTKLNIAGLLKEFLIERNTSSVIVNDLYIQLKGLSIDYLKKKGIKKDIENIAEDIRGEVIDKILESAHKEFWKDNLGSKKVNDKIINSYVYTIIRECYRNVTENFSNGESDLLYKAINIIFEELVNKGLLYQINNEYYSRNNIKECTEYYENSLDIYYIDIRRGKKKEQLDHSILKEFITKIITDLENYCFTTL
jgi:hypothetical protein